MYANGPKIVTDGLTLCLDAGNTKSYLGSGTSWVDISRNGNNATLINGPTFDSSNIGSIVFDGSNDYADLPTSSLVSGSQMTFALWNFGNNNTNIATSVICFENSSNIRTLNVHLPWLNVVYFDAGNGTGNSGGVYDRINKSVTVAEIAGWNYWAFTKNSTAGRMRIYLNGKLWHSGGGSAPIGTSVIGNLGRLGITGAHHNGRIAMTKLYSRELSESEIFQNYNATKGRFKL